jgi:RimJ/RimL family protein N-acetyltransferase
MVPVLYTDRLTLRAWCDTDRAPYAALNADPVVMEHFPSTLTADQSSEMVDRMQASWSERGYGLWAVEVTESADFIGFVGLSAPSWTEHFTPCVEVGWRLARAAWGHGYATEAARDAISWGFASIDGSLGEIVSFTSAGNVRSRAVMERLGMRRDPNDDFDHPLLPDWAGRRHVLYRLPRP